MDNRPRHRDIVFGPAISDEIVMHEAAHVFHSPANEDSPNPALPAVGEVGLYRHAQATGWADRFDAHVSLHERLADSLAWLWMERK
jgi:hypothetical protein